MNYVNRITSVYGSAETGRVHFFDNVNNMRSVVYENNNSLNVVKQYKFSRAGDLVTSAVGYDGTEYPKSIALNGKTADATTVTKAAYSACEDLHSVPNGRFNGSVGWTFYGGVTVSSGKMTISGGASASATFSKTLKSYALTGISLHADGVCANCTLSVEFTSRKYQLGRVIQTYTVDVEQNESVILIPFVDLQELAQFDNKTVTIKIKNNCSCNITVDNVCLQELDYSYTSVEPISETNQAQTVTIKTIAGDTEQTYNQYGNITSSIYTDETGVGENKRYDYTYEYTSGYGRIKKITEDESNSKYTQYTYSGGVLSSVLTNKNGKKTEVSYAYDSLGNAIRSAETNGIKQYYTYEAVNGNLRLTKALTCNESSLIEPDGTHGASDYFEAYTYNDFGQLTRITDSKGNVNEVLYDATGKPIGYDTPQGEYTYTFDTYGRIASLKNETNTIISYAYNTDGVLTRKTYQTGSGGHTISYTYDDKGYLTQMTSGSNTYGFAYDDLRRITQITTGSDLAEAFTYDAEGRLSKGVLTGKLYKLTTTYNYREADDAVTKVTDSFTQNGASKSYVHDYTYATNGSLTQLSVDGMTFGYSYDSVDRLTSRTLSLSGTVLSNVTYAYADNASGYISANVASVTDSVNTANNRYFSYDAKGNIVGIYKNSAKTSTDVTYTYDSANRLTKEAKSSSSYVQYSYNTSNDIMTAMEYLRAGAKEMRVYSDYTYTNGRLTELTTYTTTTIGGGGGPIIEPMSLDIPTEFTYYFAYDSLGNPVKYKLTSTTAANNLTWQGRELASGTLGSNSFSYKYNANGIRYEKTLNGLTTKYYLSGTTILAEERLTSSGAIDKFIYYIYDATGVAGMVVHNGAPNSSNGTKYLFTKNLQGDIIGIKNSANQLVGSYTYDAWGNCSIGTNTGGIATLNPFRYRGYYFDTETGFYYLQSRYYDPSIRRFINADDPEILGDLASIVGQLNLYAYCGNNPVMLTDPTGYFWDTIIDIGFAIWGLTDLIREPSWENAGWFVLDVLFLLVPFIPGVGKATKAITKVDDIIDATKFVNRGQDIFVIGQNMAERVIPYADEIGALFYRGFSHYDDVAKVSRHLANGIGYIHNMGYIAGKALMGARFIDIGMDASRAGIAMYRFSRFTIYSEMFVAQVFRISNAIRLLYHLY